ncbi:Phosphate-selective porin O and P [Botrimarina colliarenosi]|uniref:Phosphate-selective porin O and P n=1 Tax=Botrimarina colliarenosi TaxID=2528001 RepID=A0A5C6ACE2_9BACT|nr:porin [Botrimarina colliarenosi]TWT96815.1 Phosphate-selective porin O and P [Botrimarina colliarenosi]
MLTKGHWLARGAATLALTLGLPAAGLAQGDIGWTLDPTPLQATTGLTHHSGVVLASLTDGGDSGVASDDAALSARLEALEAKHDDLESAYESLEKSLKGYAQTGHSSSTMKISGRIHADLWGFPGDSPGVDGFESDDPNLSPQDRIEFRRVRFGVAGDLPSNMVYKIEMEFAGGDDSQFRDVYLGWDELPVFQMLLLGNQKRPYGLDHINSSRYNVFIERPFVIEGFNQDSRRFGLQSYGFSEDLAWNWRYGVFNQRLIQDEGKYVSDHWQGQIAGRLANTIWYDEASDGRGYAHWAVSGTWADTDQNANDENFADSGIDEARFRTRPEARTDSRWLDTGVIAGSQDYSLLGLEAVMNVGPCQLVAEHQQVWLNRLDNRQVNFHGSYAYLSYFFTGEHMPWDRETGALDRITPFENFFLVDTCRGGCGHGMGAWQIAARWSYADFADQDIQGGVGESFTLGLNWYWTAYSRMQFNYLYGEIDQNDLNAAAGAPNFGNYQVLGARFMVDF